MSEVSSGQLAEALGVSKQRVSRAIKDGLLVNSIREKPKKPGQPYKFDLSKAKKEWADNIDPAKQREQDKQDQTKDLASDNTAGLSNYQRAKTASEAYRAKLYKLDYEEKAGNLISVDDVKAEAFKTARRVRDSILALPMRVSQELAHMDDAHQIQVYLREQLAEALKDLDKNA